MEKTEVAIGVDIGGTNTAIGIVDGEGKCYAKSNLETRAYETPDELVVDVCQEAKRLLSELGFEYTLRGIGVGAPNGNYYNGTIEYAPNLKWKGVIKLKDLFYREMPTNVVVTNDANAAAIGEKIYGGAQKMNDFVMITLGTGVGSGFVSNGKMIYGHDGFAGELGHITIVPEGRVCGCGRKGCLEAYASATGIARTMVELLETTSEPSVLRDVPTEKIDGKKIYEAARSGDKLAIEAFDKTGEILGRGLATAAIIASPEAFFLMGGLTGAGDLILHPTKTHFEANLLKIFQNKIKILFSQLDSSNVAILGAAALAFE